MSSYERLAERLIETQRTMLGKRAVDIARSVEGIEVTDDGQVANVVDDDRATVGALVDSYVDVMGVTAQSRLTEVAQEYEDLVLPANLGGPGPDDEDAADAETDSAVVTNIWGEEYAADSTDPDSANPIDVVETDLNAIYVAVDDGTGSAARVPLSQAIVDTVVAETDLERDQLDEPGTYVDAIQVVRLVDADPGTYLSFTVEEQELHLHQDGTITVE
ncbi:hypothetical protein ACFR9U_04005 [Halorientalis brevis]|uniref:Halobacterial output domain-containing protein n=1 Tax=Halorientalis brevis TaxID=1126241 RepID=A0ABD6C7W0_9EURY|nr:hypothetical protein [Halorientalis brevis]